MSEAELHELSQKNWHYLDTREEHKPLTLRERKIAKREGKRLVKHFIDENSHKLRLAGVDLVCDDDGEPFGSYEVLYKGRQFYILRTLDSEDVVILLEFRKISNDECAAFITRRILEIDEDAKYLFGGKDWFSYSEEELMETMAALQAIGYDRSAIGTDFQQRLEGYGSF